MEELMLSERRHVQGAARNSQKRSFSLFFLPTIKKKGELTPVLALLCHFSHFQLFSGESK